MQLEKIDTKATMSSREIAELTGKRHDHVMTDIRNLLNELNLIIPVFSGVYKAENNQEYACFNLPKRETLILVSGYSVTLRSKIIDRWQELEAQQAPQVPKTMAQALRLAADQAETIEQQAQQLQLAAPAVQFVERYVEAKSSKSLSDVAKVLGWKPQAFIKQLADEKVIFKRGGSWLPFQDQIDAERFTVNTGESNGHAFNQTRVEPKGVAWLAKKYGK
jgi:phage antirepressor YoqD-like protein